MRALLKQIEVWQKTIALQLAQQHPETSAEMLLTTTRQFVLAILWLILCEQRGVVTIEPLQEATQHSRYPQLLKQLQQVADQLGQPFPLALPDRLLVDDRLFDNLMTGLRCAATTVPLPSHLLGQVYEQSLGWSIARDDRGQVKLDTNAIRRKSGGVYYTPEPIVNYVLDQAIDVISPSFTLHPSSFSPPFLLDPACGSGVFLLAAYQRLLDWYGRSGSTHSQRQQLTPLARSQILQHHIYGVDLDAQAVAVTRLSLWLKLMEAPQPWQYPLPDLSRNICCGDAVMGETGGFEWTKQFPQILQTGGFDAVIGNPPYVDAEVMALHLPQVRQHCSQHYRSATGNWDLFCVFIEKAIDLCRPGGLVSLVVPNKLASADYASTVRQMLTQENQLLTLRDYAQVPVFAASVYPMVFVAQKLAAKAESLPVRYELMQDLHQVRQARSIDLHSCSSHQGWRLTSNPQQSCLMARLQQDCPTLGEIATVRGAATVTEAYAMQALIHNTSLLNSEDLQVVNSGTIDRYRLLWGAKPLRYLGQSHLYPVIPADWLGQLPSKRYQQARQPKIIVAGMSQRLECAFDRAGCVLAAKSTSIVWVESGAIDLRYLLGLLNSRLLSFYFSHAFGGNRLQGGYLRVGPPQLRSLPVALPNLDSAEGRRHYQQMIEWVEQRLTGQLQSDVQLDVQPDEAQSDGAQLDEAIDELVYQLYGLTTAERDEIIEPALSR